MSSGVQITKAPRRWFLTTDHRTIGIAYLLLSLIAVAVGTMLSIFMRIHIVAPNLKLPLWGVVPPEGYLALVTMHGTLMVFFVLTTAPVNGFASLVLPAQIGARRMALPLLNAVSLWLTVVSFGVLISAFFVGGGAPISGWTNYPPLSAIAAAGPGQAAGMDLWLASIGIFCLASVLSAINLLTTVISKRCEGMTAMRMPLTVWAWLVTAVLILFAFSVLFAAVVLLLSDRHLATSFFVPPGEVIDGLVLDRTHPHASGSPMLWLHLFWFFGHPEVYIAILPAMGLTSSLLANFTRRPVFSYRFMVATTLAIGFFGLLVWGHHMFVSGMNPYAGTAFALTTMAIAIPSSAKMLGWMAMLSRGRDSRVTPLPTPMLFTLGFLSFFIAGGLTGPILAQPVLDAYLHNTYFVVAHFHLIMAMAGMFSLFAAVYYWFPLMTGRMMNERLGKWHFWLSLVGAYATFFPMHFAGLAGQPRHYAQLTGSTSMLNSLLPLQTGITHSALFLATAQLLFLINLVWSVRRGEPAGANPWRATTLEWAPDNIQYRVNRGPYEYRFHTNSADFVLQCAEEAEQE
ncbi:cbb3-type cytochrome c oxidase subunit I [Alloacidobacterium dinghuense]|uniref:Cbb3-type cytochrome c oxidase subunit I n=1 Tax=Alloacidobacterium dinghuense TaxID=2763107 RepID=A0A7G8BN92_9BACT|nr:cbb3-type cytochrome c oxidase subunit I [Alloacidobacterium dinghuense]QNI34012.1 cbb3-type cytochrome c oxidase subunit I [Alloacidobacterium dinghuense]